MGRIVVAVVELEEGLAPTAGVVLPMQVEVGQNVQEHHGRARVREDRGHRLDLKKAQLTSLQISYIMVVVDWGKDDRHILGRIVVAVVELEEGRAPTAGVVFPM